ncbi:MAG TPA: hypothetical protein VD833_20345, partial [Vicinamibacterales bacterium]|nr:hypothetical protein [Vicinamibacterales bacterium]
ARAAGLDEQIVIDVAEPLFQEVRQHDIPIVPAESIEIEVESLPEGPRELGDPADLSPARRTPRRRAALIAALPVAALVAIGVLVPEVRQHLNPIKRDVVVTSAPRPAGEESREPAPPAAASVPLPAANPPGPAPAGSTGTMGGRRAERPAAGLEPIDYSPASANAGSASFQEEPLADSRGGNSTAGPSGAVLRITRIVNDTARNFHVRPSPDGSRVAFDSDRDGVRGVYVANEDGSNLRRLTGNGFAAVPSWSPDGRMLAYVRAESDHPQVWNLWTMDLESRSERRLTSHRRGQPWGASWFPDGRRVAYGLEDRLVILDIETGRQRFFEAPRERRSIRAPAVSPDGRWIVFHVDRDGAWLLDVAGGSMRRVLADPQVEDYTWSPDGRRIAYHNPRSGEWGIWLMTHR